MFLKMFVDASAALSWFVESTKFFVGRKVCLKFAALTRFWCKNGTASVCYLMQCAMLDGRNNRFFFPWEQMFFLMQIIFIVLSFNSAVVQNLYYWMKVFHGIYKHQEFQFPLLDAAHCGTESEHQVSDGSLIGMFSLFILSPFTRILELCTK